MDSSNRLHLMVVVNGVETLVEANADTRLRSVAEHALSASGNSGRPLSDWELKNEQGVLIDLDRTVASYGFAPNALLYLTLTVGVNGAISTLRPRRLQKARQVRI